MKALHRPKLSIPCDLIDHAAPLDAEGWHRVSATACEFSGHIAAPLDADARRPDLVQADALDALRNMAHQFAAARALLASLEGGAA